MTPIACAVLGMPPQERYTYEYFFREYEAGHYQLVLDADAASVLLIDIDTAEGRRLAQTYFRSPEPGRTVIAISANDSHPDHVLLLAKPVSPAALKALLDKVETLPRSAPAPTEASAPAARSDARQVAAAALAMEDGKYSNYLFHSDADPSHMAADELYFDADQHLCGTVHRAWEQARTQGTGVELRSSFGAIRILPREGRLQTDLSDKVLRSLAVTRTPFETLPLTATGDGALAGAPIEAFLWKLAAWTSRGRLPAGTSLDTPIRLRRWPNMTRLLPTPHAMQIAALWTSGAYSLRDTAKRLMISHGDVHVFYCCVRALGLLAGQEAARTAPAAAPAQAPAMPATATAPAEPSPAAPPPQRNRGLLSRILGRLLTRSA